MLNVTSHTKASYRVVRRTAAPDLSITTLRSVPSSAQPIPAPRPLWQRLWTALTARPSLEQLYARQQRRAGDERRPVMTLGGHLTLPCGPETTRPAHPVQADLP